MVVFAVVLIGPFSQVGVTFLRGIYAPFVSWMVRIGLPFKWLGNLVWSVLLFVLRPLGRFLQRQLAEMGKLLLAVGAGAMLAWWGAVSASSGSSHPLSYDAPVFVFGAVGAFLGIISWIVGENVKPESGPTHVTYVTNNNYYSGSEFGPTGAGGPADGNRNVNGPGYAISRFLPGDTAVSVDSVTDPSRPGSRLVIPGDPEDSGSTRP
jgi:hypothetical protein